MAEAFGQAATQAPHPIHWAASMALSEASFGMRMTFASGALPVRTEIYPPAWITRSKAVRSIAKSLMTGKPLALNGSMMMVSPFLKWRI